MAKTEWIGKHPLEWVASGTGREPRAGCGFGERDPALPVGFLHQQDNCTCLTGKESSLTWLTPTHAEHFPHNFCGESYRSPVIEKGLFARI